MLEQHKEGCDLCSYNTNEILDKEITEEEIQEVTKALKNNNVLDNMEFQINSTNIPTKI